jgi:O-antigen ligase
MGRSGEWRALPPAERLIELGVLAYLVAVPFGTTLSPWVRHVSIAAVMLGLVRANLPLGRDAGNPIRYRLLAPLLLFAGSSLLSIVASVHPMHSLMRSSYAPVALLFFFAGQHVARDSRSLGRLFLGFTVLVLLLGTDGLWQFATGGSLLGDRPLQAGRVSGSLPHPNDLGLLPILLPFAAWRLLAPGSAALRFLAAPALLVGLFTVLFSQSRNAWLGTAVGLGAMLVLGGHRRVMGALCGLALGGFLLAFVLDVGIVRERAGSLLSWRDEGRIGVWAVGWRMFEEAPLLGKGPHTFAEHYAEYGSEVELPSGTLLEERAMPWAHNLYLEALAERGAVGFAALMLTVLAMLKRLRDTGGLTEGSRSPLDVVAIASSVFVFLGMGLFDLTFLKDWVLWLFCLLAALAAQVGADLRPDGAAEA